MKFDRLNTIPGVPISDQILWKTIDAKITDADGEIIFEQKAIEVPEHWSQTSANILVQKYFRKSGVPELTLQTRNKDYLDYPIWLLPSVSAEGVPTFGEYSAKQVFHRLAGAWSHYGWNESYFDSEEDAKIFYDETYYMLAKQYAAPNSPQWFNTGLWWAYGIEGPDTGQWVFDNDGNVTQVKNSYERPQIHACFLTPVADDLVNPGGIMDLWVREAKIFKQGGGSGTNISSVRGKNEKLSGGGFASGVMSFLRIGDAAAGAIASGGTTRRAAKMVCIDIDHPEVEDFIDWKVREESKAAAMYVGSLAITDKTLHSDVTPQAIKDRQRIGIEPEIYSIDWEGEAINTVSGQNSNNSIRITEAFLSAVVNDVDWKLYNRDGTIAKTIPAKDLWNKICRAAWASADPGLLFHDTINSWNTCSADGEIRTTNPCAEYHFLDNTACNLASLNLVKFLKGDKRTPEFDIPSFEHATRIWTTILDISVSMASYPSAEFAQGAYNYRTLGLGYANLGGLLHRMNLRYDSQQGRELAKAITALMHLKAYKTSNELAENLSPFPRYEANKEPMQKVISKSIDHIKGTLYLKLGAYDLFDSAYNNYVKMNLNKGFRNAQGTLIAPTGTIAIIMGCTDDGTTGIEPYFSKNSTKSLSGGGEINFAHDVADEDCAMPSYPGGPCLSPLAHVKMVAAVQSFLSGAVSKTVNLPNTATVEDVGEIYREAHRLGLKSIAIYRDGSKLTQPLNLNMKEELTNALKISNVNNPEYEQYLNKAELFKFVKENIVPNIPIFDNNKRKSLQSKRSGYTQKMRVGGNPLYLRTGEYEDGSLGEIFITLSNEGSTMRSLMEGFAKAISVGLQYGVPLSEFVDAFVNTRFEPAGVVQEHERIKLCSSLLDLIFRDLAVNYLNRDDLAHLVPVDKLKSVENIMEHMQGMQGLPSGGFSDQNTTQVVMMNKQYNTGNICPECGNATLIQTGTCSTCSTCDYHTGCG